DPYLTPPGATPQVYDCGRLGYGLSGTAASFSCLCSVNSNLAIFPILRGSMFGSRSAEQTLESLVARVHGCPKQRPRKLVVDRGYDTSALRCALRRRGTRMFIPPKRRQPPGRPSAAAQWSRARTTIDTESVS